MKIFGLFGRRENFPSRKKNFGAKKRKEGARRPRQSRKQRAKIHVRTNVSQQKGRPEGQKSKLLLNTDITDEDRLRNCVLNHAT